MEVTQEGMKELNVLWHSIWNKYDDCLSFASDGSLVDKAGNTYVRSEEKPMIKISECVEFANKVYGCKKVFSAKDCIKIRVMLWPYNFPVYDHVAYAQSWNEPVDLASILKTFVGSYTPCQKKVSDFYSERNIPFTHLQSIYFYRLESKVNKQGHSILHLQIKVY